MAIHIQQPPNSDQCGQCCVAMLAGVSRLDVIKRIGAGRTTTADIVAALNAFDVPNSGKLRKVKRPLVDGLYRIPPRSGSNWHWVCRINGVWHDPNRLSGRKPNKSSTFIETEPV